MRKWHERWLDDDRDTLLRIIEADQDGILVNCDAEWSAGIANNPLLLINVYLDREYPAFCVTHLPKHPGPDRHVSIAHMHVV